MREKISNSKNTMPGISMKVKHNKKRNVGLIFAQLSQYVSEALVEGDIEKSKKALSILKKHFIPGSELFREFRLFRAMIVTSVPSDSLATSIISEAKSAARNLNTRTLQQEKSLLIKDINYSLPEPGFYNRRVSEYKSFATLQTLLSEWRSDNPDIAVISKFESELHSHLLKEKSFEDINDFRTPDVNNLVVEIMHKKIEEKYGDSLTASQVELLREYVFSNTNENQDAFKKYLFEVKRQVIESVDRFSYTCENDILSEQLSSVKEGIKKLEPEEITDDSISRYLTLIKLTEELTMGGQSNG